MAKNRKNNRKASGLGLLWWLAGCFVLMFIMLRPELQPMRDSAAFDIVFRLVVSFAILHFTYLRSTKPVSMAAKITMTACAWLPWQMLLILSGRFSLLTATILTFAGVAVLLYEQIRLHKHTVPLLYITMFLIILLLDTAGAYTYLNNPDGIHYWQISLLGAVLCGAGAAWLVYRDILYLKDNRISEKIAVCFCGLLLGAILIWPTAMNLNYILDTSEPQIDWLPLEEKNINTSGKSTTYYLYLKNGDSQLKMDVSQSDYYCYEVGNLVPVSFYQGAFQDPYYILE